MGRREKAGAKLNQGGGRADPHPPAIGRAGGCLRRGSLTLAPACSLGRARASKLDGTRCAAGTGAQEN